MESIEEISLSVLKGDKLFNENTPFAINISFPEKDESIKKYNTDLICVIDSSSSMRGRKIYQVKESLKILINLMGINDRLALISFNRKAKTIFKLKYITDKNKYLLEKEIDLIDTYTGTNILSGLDIAINMIKEENIIKKNEERVTSIILLSDGCDSYHTEEQLANSLKEKTKGCGLSFTLHTFGYGNNYDAKIMNKLASLRDGSFYYVEDYNNVSEYFASVLGGCFSVVSQKADLKVELIKKDCKLVKIFGLDKLYNTEFKDDIFKTSILQLAHGREYSFVFEVKINEENIKIGEDLLNVELIYKDINTNDIINKNIIYKYELKSINYEKANEEYIRSHVYSVLDEVMQLKEKGDELKAKQLLKEIKEWIKINYKGNDMQLIIDVEKSYGIFNSNDIISSKTKNFISSEIMQNQLKKPGSNKKYYNSTQKLLSSAILKPVKNNKFNLFNSAQIKNDQIDLLKSSVFLRGSIVNFEKNE